MSQYAELVKALRETATFTKFDDLLSKREQKLESLAFDAAAAIEELDAEETRLLLITSELQDKVVELEEELNDVDIAADDNARQVEELQAEIRESMQKCAECGDRCVEVVRCRECKHHEDEEPGMVYCPKIVGSWVSENWFCADGERKVQE